MRRTALIAQTAALLLTVASSAEARKEKELTYRYNQVWTTAIRFLRVDQGFPITEKDQKSGYVLFEYLETGRKFQGSLELFPAVREGKRYVRASLRIGGMPSYVEGLVLDKLLRKLQEEHGEPPPAAVDVPLLASPGAKDDKKAAGKNPAPAPPPKDDAEEDDLEPTEKKNEQPQEEE